MNWTSGDKSHNDDLLGYKWNRRNMLHIDVPEFVLAEDFYDILNNRNTCDLILTIKEEVPKPDSVDEMVTSNNNNINNNNNKKNSGSEKKQNGVEDNLKKEEKEKEKEKEEKKEKEKLKEKEKESVAAEEQTEYTIHHFPTHKAFICSRSRYFEALCYGPMAKSISKQHHSHKQDELQLDTPINRLTFLHFLEFIYTDNVARFHHNSDRDNDEPFPHGPFAASYHLLNKKIYPQRPYYVPNDLFQLTRRSEISGKDVAVNNIDETIQHSQENIKTAHEQIKWLQDKLAKVNQKIKKREEKVTRLEDAKSKHLRLQRDELAELHNLKLTETQTMELAFDLISIASQFMCPKLLGEYSTFSLKKKIKLILSFF